MVEYTLKIKKIKTPTDANWVTDISGGYTEIKGRVYDFTKVKNGVINPDGSERDPFKDYYGYWKASAEITSLINPFTNPITNAVVKEAKIEVSFTDERGWGNQMDEKNYFEYLIAGCVGKIKRRYKELYGVEIDLSYIKVPEEKKDEKDAPITELSLKYISHVGGEEVKKINFEVYENVNGNLTLLAEIKDFTAFEIDKTTKKISAKLLDIDERYYESNKLEKWLDKNRDKLPKDTKYVFAGYPLEEKKDITTETKKSDDKVVDNSAVIPEGEFTFDVQEDNIFKGVNNQFKELEIIGTGEIKENPLDKEQEVIDMEDEMMDEEYIEEDFEGLSEKDMQFEVAENTNIGSDELEYSTPPIENKSKDGAGMSANDWEKNGTIVTGSKVPSNLSGPVKYDQKVTLSKSMTDEYLPIIKKMTGYTTGVKLLAIIMAQKEGFQKGTRSYRTNNPGNIGNTDSGGDKTLKNLEAGIKLQLDYIKKVAKGEHTSYPLDKEKYIKPYYSPEIAKNNGPKGSYKGMTEYLPGYKFTYTGMIEQYVKIYATGARSGNSYITMIVSWYRQNGYNWVNEETKIAQLIEQNSKDKGIFA
jgi:hypothetical protein